MNPLHLLWIVPLSCTAGVFVMAWCAANEASRTRDRIRDLRFALRDLILTVDGERIDRQSKILRRSVALARDVLGGKGAE